MELKMKQSTEMIEMDEFLQGYDKYQGESFPQLWHRKVFPINFEKKTLDM